MIFILEPKLVTLKHLIIGQTEILEQGRLIGAIIDEYKKESEIAQQLAKDHSALQLEHANLKKAHLELQEAQTKESPQFVFHNGVLWKKNNAGFENFPYCNECAHHPVMTPMPPNRATNPMFWQCSANHRAPNQGKPRA